MVIWRDSRSRIAKWCWKSSEQGSLTLAALPAAPFLDFRSQLLLSTQHVSKHSYLNTAKSLLLLDRLARSQLSKRTTKLSKMSRPSTSRSVNSSYSTYPYYGPTSTTSRVRTGQASRDRPSTARHRTGASTLAASDQQIICAVSESRGVAPTVGLAFVNLDTGEAALSQICDNQAYVRTLAKLAVYCPSQILIMSTAANPKSKMLSTIEDHVENFDSSIILLDRRYWAENTGFDYIQQLAFAEDVEAIKLAIGTNYFAVCCIAAVGSSAL